MVKLFKSMSGGCKTTTHNPNCCECCHFDWLCDVMNTAGICGRSAHSSLANLFLPKSKPTWLHPEELKLWNKRTKRHKNPFLLLKYWYDHHTTPANGNKCTFSGFSGQPLPGSPLMPFAALTLWSSLGLSPFQAGTHIKSRLTLSLRKWPEGPAGGAGQWQSARIGCGLHWRTTWGLPTGTWHGCRIHPGHHNRLKQFHDVIINAGQAAGKPATFNRHSAS